MEELQLQEVSSKLEDLKQVIGSFSQLLKAENQALKEFNVEAVSALYEQKTKIVAAYRSMSAFFIKSPQSLDLLDDEKKKELKSVSQELDALLKENDLLLKTRMETSKNVMNTIINIAKVTNNRNATSYGSQGRYSPLDNNKNALAVNRTL